MSLVALLLLRGIGTQERRIDIQVDFETNVRVVKQSAGDALLTAVRRDVGLRLDPCLDVLNTGNRSEEGGRLAPPLVFPRFERAKQVLTDNHRLQAMNFIVQD